MKIVVIKCGGTVIYDPSFIDSTIRDITQLKALGMYPVIVHGGGPMIAEISKKMGLQEKFVDGLRVTSKEMLAVVQMVLIGKINKDLVSFFQKEKKGSVGISGHDGNLLIATQADKKLGFVGNVTRVNPEIILSLIQADYIPIIAPIASSSNLESYNVNADTVASKIAVALGAEHLVILTNVRGVFSNIEDPLSKIDQMESMDVFHLIKGGKLKGGMIPKLKSALAALQGGVKKVHILDGTSKGSLCHFPASITGTTIYA